jgi:FdhD protein
MGEPAVVPLRHATPVRILRLREGWMEPAHDQLAREEPLEIRLAGPHQEPQVVAVTMRTPGHEEELAAGFLYSEGLLGDATIVGWELGDPGVLAHPDDTIVVRLSRPVDPAVIPSRIGVVNASCGICGKTTIDAVAIRCPALRPGPVVAAATLLQLPDRLRTAQAAFQLTGGLHAAALFDPQGQLLLAREDVGRHNALDKVVGARLLAGLLPLHPGILMVSGRISFEIVQKAALAGAPIVCAVSAPSDLAVEAADRLGLTLVGFLRSGGFNVYTHPERIHPARTGSGR